MLRRSSPRNLTVRKQIQVFGEYSEGVTLSSFTLRTLTSAGMVLLALSALAQDDTKINFESKAATLPTLLKKLSDPAKATLEAGSEYSNVPLILSLHDAPLKDVMDKIAAVTLGKWTKTSTGYRLNSDTDKVKELQTTAAREREAAMAEAIKSYLDRKKAGAVWDKTSLQTLIDKEIKDREALIKDIKKNNPNLGDNGRIRIMKGSSSASTPASPALYEVLSRISPQVLAQIGPGQRVVYSPNPTRMQKSFPVSATGAINRFVESHNLLANASKPITQPPNVTVSGGLDLGAKPISVSGIKLIMIAQRFYSDPGVQVQIKFADASGSIIGSASAYINPNPKTEDPQKAVPIEEDGSVTFGDLSMELARAYVNSALGSGGGGSSYVVVSNEARFRIGSTSPTPAPLLSAAALSALADPGRQDPLSFFVSDGVLAVAHATGSNLVALVPDSAVLPLAQASIKDPKASQFALSLAEAKVRATKEGGWLTFSPSDPLSIAATQMDRAAAARLFAPVHQKGYARLNEVAKFALSLGPNPQGNNFGVTALKVLDPFVADTLTTALQDNAALFQFLGTIQPEVFEATNPRVVYSVGNLAPNQKTLLEKVAYGGDRFSGIIGEGDFIGISISDGPEDAPQESGPSLRNEPTESMPNGLPVQGEITLKFAPRELVKASVTGQRGGQFMTAGMLGSHLSFKDRTQDPEIAAKLTSYDSFLEAVGFDIELKTEFVRGAPQTNNYLDSWLKPGGIALKYESLSESFRDAVAKAKDSMAGNRIGFGQGEVPPR